MLEGLSSDIGRPRASQPFLPSLLARSHAFQLPRPAPFRPPSVPAGEGQSPRASPPRQLRNPPRRSLPRSVKPGDPRGSGSLRIPRTCSKASGLLSAAFRR